MFPVFQERSKKALLGESLKDSGHRSLVDTHRALRLGSDAGFWIHLQTNGLPTESLKDSGHRSLVDTHREVTIPNPASDPGEAFPRIPRLTPAKPSRRIPRLTPAKPSR
jgi:hypothetical protein